MEKRILIEVELSVYQDDPKGWTPNLAVLRSHLLRNTWNDGREDLFQELLVHAVEQRLRQGVMEQAFDAATKQCRIAGWDLEERDQISRKFQSNVSIHARLIHNKRDR